jgi:hypothetical protein
MRQDGGHLRQDRLGNGRPPLARVSKGPLLRAAACPGHACPSPCCREPARQPRDRGRLGGRQATVQPGGTAACLRARLAGIAPAFDLPRAAIHAALLAPHSRGWAPRLRLGCWPHWPHDTARDPLPCAWPLPFPRVKQEPLASRITQVPPQQAPPQCEEAGEGGGRQMGWELQGSCTHKRKLQGEAPGGQGGAEAGRLRGRRCEARPRPSRASAPTEGSGALHALPAGGGRGSRAPCAAGH